ncbi:MAG TPA: DsbA family protein [Solirubrobacteraceae bacterium]|jgi:2-hydroxychromene-2-carboxylate isomerase|nr:DsbA family protein [Solirubrobacteraceae bacterium]
MARVTVTHFTDPGCPFAYSATPALAVLHWRYAEQLDWRLVTIGLAESAQRYIDAGYTPARSTASNRRNFGRFGMPLLAEPRARVVATSRACRAIIAARRLHPGREEQVLRALQFGWFTTTLLMDEDDAIASVLSAVEGIDAMAVVAAIEDPEVLAEYERDKDETRQAAGGATEFQGKARQTDGPVRYSAPSLVFTADGGQRLEAGGFQTIEAYDVLIANLDTTLERRGEAEDPLEVLQAFPDGLVTQEIAAVMAPNNAQPDAGAAEDALIELAGRGTVRREPLADDALWRIAS